MLADPITVAANAPNPALSFSTTKADGYGSQRVDGNLGGYDLTISHTPGKTTSRHYVKLTKGKDAVDPYTGQTRRVTESISLSIVQPSFGFTNSEVADLWKAFKDTVDDADVTIARLLLNQS